MILTPTQTHMQDQLQRKHEHLQHLIVQQQEELRIVSEQLLMTRYGILPPIVNVCYPATSTAAITVGSPQMRADVAGTMPLQLHDNYLHPHVNMHGQQQPQSSHPGVLLNETMHYSMECVSDSTGQQQQSQLEQLVPEQGRSAGGANNLNMGFAATSDLRPSEHYQLPGQGSGMFGSSNNNLVQNQMNGGNQ